MQHVCQWDFLFLEFESMLDDISMLIAISAQTLRVCQFMCPGFSLLPILALTHTLVFELITWVLSFSSSSQRELSNVSWLGLSSRINFHHAWVSYRFCKKNIFQSISSTLSHCHWEQSEVLDAWIFTCYAERLTLENCALIWANTWVSSKTSLQPLRIWMHLWTQLFNLQLK